MSVALTFDDGPDRLGTPRVLDALGDVRATFFVMGSAVAQEPDALRAVLDAGHDVQLHCHRHTRHTELGAAGLAEDTDRALEALDELGVQPRWWRAPWGVLAPFSAQIAAERGLRLAGWTADTEDWAGETAPVLLDRVAPELAPDAVVLMHDGLGPGARRWDCEETVALLPGLVEAIGARGLVAGPLPAPEAVGDWLPAGAPGARGTTAGPGAADGPAPRGDGARSC